MSLVIHCDDVVALVRQGRPQKVEGGGIAKPAVKAEHFQRVTLWCRVAGSRTRQMRGANLEAIRTKQGKWLASSSVGGLQDGAYIAPYLPPALVSKGTCLMRRVWYKAQLIHLAEGKNCPPLEHYSEL